MEGINMIMKKNQQQPSYKLFSPISPPLSLHKDSQTIAKAKPPKIRIIHLFAPEIIKTDVDNFRELVQRLTGKPTEKVKPRKKAPKMKSSQVVAKKMELRNEFGRCLGGVKGEEEEEEMVMWKGATSGGFLSGFSEMDGFGEFPLMPMAMDVNHHLHLHGFEESQLA